MFQFHTGSIKSAENGCRGTAVVRFNSILVRLKVTRITIARDAGRVSIPYWFD